MGDLREHLSGDLRDDGQAAPRSRSAGGPPATVPAPEEKTPRGGPGGLDPCQTDSGPSGGPGGTDREEGVTRFAPGGERCLRFVGRGVSLLGLYVANFCSMVLTLGVYSFWGKTRIRRYMWSRTLVCGDPLEYTGTGWQLCRSFLIVISLFFGFNLLVKLLSLASLAASVLLSLVFMLALLLFWPYAVYSALRFRLARTHWRGIHGRLAGSPVEYAMQSWMRAMLVVATLGLFAPRATAFLTRYIVNNASFGSEEFRFEADVKNLSRPYYLCWLAGLLVLLGTGAALGALVAEQPFPARHPEPALFLPLAPGALGLLVCRLIYGAALLNWRIRGIRFAGTRLDSRISMGGYLGLTLSNGLLLIATLGIAWPWTVVRRYRYVADRVLIRGEIRWSDIRQSDTALPQSGEGLLSFLDLNLGF